MPYVKPLILSGSIWRGTVLDTPGPSDAEIELVQRGSAYSTNVLMHERVQEHEIGRLITWLEAIREQVRQKQGVRP